MISNTQAPPFSARGRLEVQGWSNAVLKKWKQIGSILSRILFKDSERNFVSNKISVAHFFYWWQISRNFAQLRKTLKRKPVVNIYAKCLSFQNWTFSWFLLPFLRLHQHGGVHTWCPRFPGTGTKQCWYSKYSSTIYIHLLTSTTRSVR